MAAGCLLDTSYLIALASRERQNHATARQYFEHCVRNSVPLYLPTLVVMEFYRKQTLDKLGLNNFIILPLNFDEAVKAAEFAELLEPSADGMRSKACARRSKWTSPFLHKPTSTAWMPSSPRTKRR